MSVYHASLPDSCTHKYKVMEREGKPERRRERSVSDEASHNGGSATFDGRGGEDSSVHCHWHERRGGRD